MARDAAVSQSAVSRAFAGRTGVSEETRGRIFAAAERLGYQPNALARGLSTQRSGIVGVVISQLTNPFLSDALDRLSQKLRAAGLKPFLITVDNEREFDAAFPALAEYRVDGCFVISPHLARDVARKYGTSDATVLLFNRALPGLRASTVHVDNVAGGRAAADLLGGRGPSPDRLSPRRARLGDRPRSLRRFLGNGLPNAASPRRRSAGETIPTRARRDPLSACSGTVPDLTAVFCANDIMAMGAMDAARHQLGLKVPEQLSIVGFDDAPPAAWPGYDLTTIRQPVDEMIDAGTAIMLAEGRDPGRHPTRRVFEGSLVIRGSTLTPRKPAAEA